jgi:hypothetical protein
MDDIFSPRTIPFISESIFDLITEKTEIKASCPSTFSPSRSSTPVYEAEPDDTPWYWYTTDQRNWIAQGITHIVIPQL